MAQTKAQLISGASSQSVTFNDATVSSINGGPIGGARNRIINGDMRIDQRNAGASVTLSTTTQYPVDRFPAYKDTSGATVTAQRSTTAPAGFTNSIVFTASTGAAPAVGAINAFWQSIEGFNFADLGWGTASASSVTLSFWVRSSVIGTYSFSLTNDASNRFYVATYSINVANTWEYKTITIAGDTSGTWATDNSKAVQITWDLGYGTNFNGTAGAWGSSTIRRTSGSVQWISTTGATFYITGVQLEAGSVATPFERRSYSTEFDMCRRYCEVYANTNGTDAGIPQYFAGIDVSNRAETTLLYYPKRAAPSITVSDATKITWVTAANTAIVCSSFGGTPVGTTTNSANLFFNVSSGVTTNTLSAVGCIIFNAAASITVSAEL